MFESIRRAHSLLSAESRRQLRWLVPLMLASSASDVLTVIFASAFFGSLDDGSTNQLAAAAQTLGISTSTTEALTPLVVLIVFLVANALTVYATFRVNEFGYRQIITQSEATLAAILRRDYDWFLGQSSAKLKQQTLVEVQRTVNVFIVQTTQICARMLGSIAIVVFLLLSDPWLTVGMGVFLSIFYYVLYRMISRTMVRFGRQRTFADQARHQIVEEALVGVKELKLHRLESVAIDRFHRPNLKYAQALTWVGTLQAVGKPALEVVGITGVVILMTVFQFTGRPMNDVLTMVATYGVAAYRLLPTIQRMFHTSMGLRVEKVALDIVYDHVTRPLPELDLSKVPPLPFEESIQMESVRYSYPNTEAPVLADIDLRIPKGSWVALVGSTGSGKTTLVDLLMGLLTPEDGTIRIDGRPIEDRGAVKRWQEHIGYVPQNLFLSDTSLEQNIAFGNVAPDAERVRDAAKMAQIDEFIDGLPNGYATEIGERGMRVSGGQRQRVGIARALYRAPNLLVLDEATSALDNRTEAKVMAALRERFAKTTVLMIAHRLSTTRHCDQILILESGRILDRGSYDELLERSAYFQQMVQASEDSPPLPVAGA